jgi:hypothetical protein
LQDASAQQVVLGAAEHLPLDQLQPGDLTFRLPVAPRQLQRGLDCSFILPEPFGKRPHFAPSHVNQPSIEFLGLPLAHNGGEPQGKITRQREGRRGGEQAIEVPALLLLQRGRVGGEYASNAP